MEMMAIALALLTLARPAAFRGRRCQRFIRAKTRAPRTGYMRNRRRRPARARQATKVILDILGVSCQVEPTTAAEVAPLNQLAEDHRPEAAVAAKALAEGIVTSPVPPPPSAISS